MTYTKKAVIWDFDGTLVRFASWRMAIIDVLNECEPGHNVDSDQIRPYLRDGFPWHRPEEPHIHITHPDQWWKALEPVFIYCYKGVGYPDERAKELASRVRKHMINPGRYVLYDDAISVLASLKGKGWMNIILSNHMPELPDVVKAMEISHFIDLCITSGITGYEKPNIQAFRIALESAGYPTVAWLVGDNIESDVKGAITAGIPAILVHNPPTSDVRYYADNLYETINIIEGTNQG